VFVCVCVCWKVVLVAECLLTGAFSFYLLFVILSLVEVLATVQLVLVVLSAMAASLHATANHQISKRVIVGLENVQGLAVVLDMEVPDVKPVSNLLQYFHVSFLQLYRGHF
jgi:hypothetical protein